MNKLYKGAQNIFVKKVNETIKIQNLSKNIRGFERKYQYLDSLIRYSELCLTGGTRAPSYGTDLSNLCLEILGKDNHIWFTEFGSNDELIVLDQKIEYFLQNCLLIIENSKQVQKIILMSLTQLSCIDYPRDQRVQTLGYRCITILKNILSKGNELKDLVEKSILEIIIQNIKIENWFMISDIQVSGVISFLEVPNIANLFIVDEEIFPLMHKWICQITDFIGNKKLCYNDNDDEDQDERDDQNQNDQKGNLLQNNTQQLKFSKNFHKAHQILQLIDICMSNKHLISKFIQDDTDKNYFLKMYYNFLNEVNLQFLKLVYQGEQFITYYQFQITLLSLIEKFNIVIEEQLFEPYSSSKINYEQSLSKIQIASLINMQEEKETLSIVKLPQDEIEKYTFFTIKHIEWQIGSEYDSFQTTKFQESMDQLVNAVKDDSKILEKNKKVTIMKHFAQLIRTAGSFQGQYYQKQPVGQKIKGQQKEQSSIQKLQKKFQKVYSMPMLDPLVLSACCKFIQYYFKYHMFQQVDSLKKFLSHIQNCTNLLQYLDLDNKPFEELIQLGQLHLPHEIFFKHYNQDLQDNSEEEYYEIQVNNPVVMSAVYDILDLFNFFYQKGNNDFKISRKAIKPIKDANSITKQIKKEVRELLDQKQRKGILLKLLELNDVNIRIQACRQLLSLKTIRGEKTGQLNWNLNDLSLLLSRLSFLFSSQKGAKKEQDISFIILIFCKFYTEVEPQYVEEIIQEIGQFQYDTMLDILEDALVYSFAMNEAQSQNNSDLCISTVFLMKKLISIKVIREQTQREQNLKRIKNCICYEGETFDESFPPLQIEDLCQNIGIILECFENKGVQNDSLLAFRLIKKLADILEGATYKLQENTSQLQEQEEFSNLNNQISKAQQLYQLNLNKSQSGGGGRNKSLSFQKNEPKGVQKIKDNLSEAEKIDGMIHQLKRIRQHSISLTSDQENSVTTLTSDIIKNLESQRRNAIQILTQEKANATLKKTVNQMFPLSDKNSKNFFKLDAKNEIKNSSADFDSKLQENNENNSNFTSIKDFQSIRSYTRFNLIQLIKEECTLWDRKQKFQIDQSYFTLFQIQHNLFSSQQGLSRILTFLQPDHRYVLLMSKTNLIQRILYPEQFPQKAQDQKESQKNLDFAKQVSDILLMGQKHTKLTQNQLNQYNFELFDSEDDNFSYNQMFYNIITNVTDVILLKMFIKPKPIDNQTSSDIKHRMQITQKNKKSIILSAFLRCIYFSIKSSPNDEIKESAINQAKNIQTFYKISILCKENGFIKASLGCKFLTICRLIFKHYHKMAITQLQERGPSKQSHMKQYQQLSINDDYQDQDYQEGQFKNWSPLEQIELYIATLQSIQEMVGLLYQGIFKFKVIQKQDIMLIKEIVKTLQIILEQVNSLDSVNKVFTENSKHIKNKQVQHPSLNLYPHKRHIQFIVQQLFNTTMINQLSQIFMFPYDNLDQENRKNLNLATQIYTEFFGSYFSLSQGDYHKEVCTLNYSQLILNYEQKSQVNQAFIQKMMECCLESNLSINLIDEFYVKDILISQEREILYCWSWVYIRKDEEKDNPYQKMLLLLTNYGIYIVDVQIGTKCNQCYLGSLCTDKYKVEYIILFSLQSSDSRQRPTQPLTLQNYFSGFSNQQIRLSCSFSQQTMFSQKQQIKQNMLIIFRSLEKGNQFLKVLNKLIPSKHQTSNNFLSFIYSCLFSTDNVHKYHFNDQVSSIDSPNSSFDQELSIQDANLDMQKQQHKHQIKSKNSLQFFVAVQQKEQHTSHKQKIISHEITILASDLNFQDEILVIKEKPSAIFKFQQNYNQVLQYYYFKNHMESIKDIISQDNINYSSVAQEFSVNSDRLYENVMKCFDIKRVNLKCFAKFEFPNQSDSVVNIAVSQNIFTFDAEKHTKISKTKVLIVDKGDDYVDIEFRPRFQHLNQTNLELVLTSELSRQELQIIVQQSVDSNKKNQSNQQLNEDFTSQLKHLMRQQQLDGHQNKKQINKKQLATSSIRRFSKLKETVNNKIIPKIYNSQLNQLGSLQHIKEEQNDFDISINQQIEQDKSQQDLF
ncbi:hypothetical protein TTHERM_00411560 (macronuclear) [Tetrahymena thermophila SB210]|uniref:Uncharacterized protein n=1 Tax=Tetrahymena thermophila (strain SB210) TaxID=312017 RepID=I7LW21_TETTS|nr:hypothetical protein TTHERM_00411560 [Tetrahymena thermophila SB210]EAS00605.2 hypothetical protein TTHERM_00411560 [Tetrahymena thermophila SB210]|eukprot:XP_001020850.2 hypothetical protein TTHERM_00411560 [Tetrahymena thermophila SB210]